MKKVIVLEVLAMIGEIVRIGRIEMLDCWMMEIPRWLVLKKGKLLEMQMNHNLGWLVLKKRKLLEMQTNHNLGWLERDE